MPTKLAIDPTDRSIPPVMITKVTPDADDRVDARGDRDVAQVARGSGSRVRARRAGRRSPPLRRRSRAPAPDGRKSDASVLHVCSGSVMAPVVSHCARPRGVFGDLGSLVRGDRSVAGRITSTRSQRVMSSGRSEETDHDRLARAGQFVDEPVDLVAAADSTPSVGSSNRYTAESRHIHLAMTSFCWLPPENWRAFSSTSSGRSRSARAASRATDSCLRRLVNGPDRRSALRAPSGPRWRRRGGRAPAPAPCGPPG